MHFPSITSAHSPLHSSFCLILLPQRPQSGRGHRERETSVGKYGFDHLMLNVRIRHSYELHNPKSILLFTTAAPPVVYVEYLVEKHCVAGEMCGSISPIAPGKEWGEKLPLSVCLFHIQMKVTIVVSFSP